MHTGPLQPRPPPIVSPPRRPEPLVGGALGWWRLGGGPGVPRRPPTSGPMTTRRHYRCGGIQGTVSLRVNLDRSVSRARGTGRGGRWQGLRCAHRQRRARRCSCRRCGHCVRHAHRPRGKPARQRAQMALRGEHTAGSARGAVVPKRIEASPQAC